MRLGLLLRYKGDGGPAHGSRARGRAARLRRRCGRARPTAPTPYRRSPGCWRSTERIKAGTGIMQMPARTPACAAMTAIDAAGHVRQPLPPRRSARRGRRWSRAGTACPTASRSRARRSTSRSCARSSRARRRSRTGRALPDSLCRCRTRRGLGKPLKSILHAQPRSADLHRRDHACGPAHRRRGRRRRAADHHEPGAHRPRSPNPCSKAGGGGQGRRRWPSFDIAPYRARRDGHGPAGVPRRHQTEHGALHRRHGRARQELLQRLRAAASATRRRPRRSRMPTSPGAATKRSPRCRTSSSTRSRWSARPNASRIGCRSGRRAPKTARSAPCCWAARCRCDARDCGGGGVERSSRVSSSDWSRIQLTASCAARWSRDPRNRSKGRQARG